MHNLAVREPDAFGWGMIGGLLGAAAGVLIHWKMLSDFWGLMQKADGCVGVCMMPCYAPIGFLLLFMLVLYAIAGFVLGFFCSKVMKQ